MGFKDAKKAVLAALASGAYQHEARNDIDVKNKLKTGEVTPDQVAEVIKRCRGFDHRTDKHHRDQSITVHILRKDGWYIKFYFLDPDTLFISVHE